MADPFLVSPQLLYLLSFHSSSEDSYCDILLYMELFIAPLFAHRYRPIMVLVRSASLTTISPFFEPGAPPPTLPILIAQTEVGIVDTPSKLLAQEEIGSGPTVARSAHSSARYTPYPKSTSKHPLPPKPPNKDHDEGSDGDTSDSGLTSINDTDSESDDSHLIAKPDGEAGRPGRGGYNLEEALKWEHKKYLKVKVSDFV
jgi:hypothetical protein